MATCEECNEYISRMNRVDGRPCKIHELCLRRRNARYELDWRETYPQIDDTKQK